jgi:ATP-binding cassette, subfamily B, bacterial PglK
MLKAIEFIYKVFDRQDRFFLLIVLMSGLLLALTDVAGIGSIFWFFSLSLDPNSLNGKYEFVSVVANFFGLSGHQEILIMVGLAVFVIFVLRSILAIFNVWISEYFLLSRNHKFALMLLKIYIHKPYQYFLSENTSKMSKNLLIEVQRAMLGVVGSFVKVITHGLLAILIFAFLLIQEPESTLVILMVMSAIYIALYLSIQNIELKIGKVRVDSDEARYKTSKEALDGIKEIKIFGMEGFFAKRFQMQSLRFVRAELIHKVIIQAPQFLLEGVAFGGLMAVVVYYLIQGDAPGDVVAIVSLYALAAYRLLPAFKQIFSSFAEARYNVPAIIMLLNDMISDGISLANAPYKDKVSSFKKNILLETVSFAYNDREHNVISDITLNINRNSMTALVGSTGAGKSTVLDLILGLIRPLSGQILIDGVKLSDEGVKGWQSQIGYVPQHIYLIDESIKRNIAFGLDSDEIDLSKLKHAARLAHISDFIENELPEGYDTLVGERGVRLSGGQRQRLGIARALYLMPSIIIFDEATSALDGKTEAKINLAISDIAREVTVIMVTHRLSILKKCENIVLLDAGSISDAGNYDELIERSELFNQLARPVET